MSKSVSFRKPQEANYSETFLSCRRPSSPYPGRNESLPSRFKLIRLAVKAQMARLKKHFHRWRKPESSAASEEESRYSFGSLTDPDNGWDTVLEKLHKAGISPAGYEVSAEERQACAEAMARGAQCGCLGPFGR
ncbi:hypothetical protein E8E13_009098 [Curvularia kusanoi]|uniref:Uncharacterized protein n=1 Tax=Curvularia kusanoi TaxID=90978 RepID=A0A9P4TJM6_CURKU|nr:hypothetical protein E8E13_009098 [Curvularia kusanoi]